MTLDFMEVVYASNSGDINGNLSSVMATIHIATGVLPRESFELRSRMPLNRPSSHRSIVVTP